jgi:predicted transcriptional regulator
MSKVIEVGPDYCSLGVISDLMNAHWGFTNYLEKQLGINSRELYLLYNIFLEEEKRGKPVSTVFLNKLALNVRFSASCFYFYCNSLVAKDYLSYSERQSHSFYSLTEKGLNTIDAAKDKLSDDNSKLNFLKSCTEHLLKFQGIAR